jgi:type IV pilus modification protein PilV
MKGFALIEVLVALLILSLGLFGIVGMQLSALRHSQDAYWHSLATTQLSSFFDSLRVNRSDTARAKELDRWNALNARLLPEGKGSYACNHVHCEIKVLWRSHKQQHSLSMKGALYII